MAFQRSYSKVWWGSDNQLPSMTSGVSAGNSFTSGGFYYTSSTATATNQHYHPHHHQHQQQYQNHHQQQQQQQDYQPFSGSGYHSLDYNSLKMFSGNLSRIQEVDDEHANLSKLSWEKHNSPGSLRSQDSGFSDNDESHTTRSIGGRSSKTASPSTKSDISRKSTNSTTDAITDSPASTHTIVTPPTVVRRVGKSAFYSPLVSVSRRISFSGSPAQAQSPSQTHATATVSATTFVSKETLEMKHATLDADADADMEDSFEGSSLLEQLDSFQLLNSTPKQFNDTDNDDDNNHDTGDNDVTIDAHVANDDNDDDDNDIANVSETCGNDIEAALAVKIKGKPKRRRRIVRTQTKPLMVPSKRRILKRDTSDDDDDDSETEALSSSKPTSFENVESKSFANMVEPEIVELRESKRPVPPYHNETIYLGNENVIAWPSTSESTTLPQPPPPPPAYNNETVLFGCTPDATIKLDNNDETLSSFQIQQKTRTSTPKSMKQYQQKSYEKLMSNCLPLVNYTNPLLNGHDPSLQQWLYNLSSTYDHEVMSTLQTKSIAQEAFKNQTLTTNTVAKLIRQLQQRAIYMQSDFERMERILGGDDDTAMTLYDALTTAEQLVANVTEFTTVLERRAVFFSDSRTERRKYEENLQQIRLITKDTHYSLERQHYINLVSLLDDVQVLKRYLLIALRLAFERMVRIIVQSIEYGHCDLMLRANINMVATLTNIDYDGFASLTDAFVQNEAVRALLIVCLEHKLSSVRALALRALTTICCAPAAIAQLSACDGIEIVRDILKVQSSAAAAVVVAGTTTTITTTTNTLTTLKPPKRTMENNGTETLTKRSAAERREAVSLLTQLTAYWHGPEHRVEGLKDCVESIVAGLSQLVVDEASCAQTLLLSAAALNNLSRMEVTSHYSIMSNETIFKLIETVELKQQQQPQSLSQEQKGENTVSIFVYEQIVSMLHNMSLNKKCHSHLANGCIINFITSAYEMEFYKHYNSRAECDAQRRTIKAILHTLTRLVHDSNGGGLGLELLQQQRIPAILFKLSSTSSHHGIGSIGGKNVSGEQNASCHQLSRDIELLVRQLELAQKQAQQRGYGAPQTIGHVNEANCVDTQREHNLEIESTKNGVNTGFKFNLTRQESFV